MSVRAIEAEVSIKSGVQAECTIGREVVVEIHDDVNLETLTATENGSYRPESGVDGWDRVTVAVPERQPVTEPLSVTANGQYEPSEGVDGFSDVSVNVPERIPVTESLSVTENGTYEPSEGIDGYDRVVVDVPPAIPEIEALTVTEDGTYQSSGDGYNPVTVNTGVANLRQEIAGAKTVSGCDPLTEGIAALTTYANEVTGQEDTTLSDAVETLATKWQSPEGVLPDTYQQVEYIDGSASGAVIDTGVQPNQDTWAKAKVTPLALTGDALLGTKGNSDNLDWRVFNANGNYYFDFKNIRSGTERALPVGTTKELFIHPFEKMEPYTVPKNIFINGASQTLTAKAQWYYVKIYEGDTMLRSFVPCYRKADNVVGMYDLVNGVFYTSVGSGAFTAGADI